MIRIGGIGIAVVALAMVPLGAARAAAQPTTPDDAWRQRGQPRLQGEPLPPPIESDPVYLRSRRGGHDVVLRLHEGRIAARVDGEPASRDQIEVRGHRVRVLTRDGRPAATFRLPPGLAAPPGARRERMAMGPGMGRGLMREARPFGQRGMMLEPGEFDEEPRQARFQMEQQWVRSTGRPLWNLGHPRAVLGVLMEPADRAALAAQTDYASGVRVRQVHEGLPAAEAGLRQGDIIVEANGRRGLTPDALRHLIHESGPGETLELTVLRNGREEDLEVTLREFEPAKLNWDFVLPGLADPQRGRFHAAPQRPFIEDEPDAPAERGQPPRDQPGDQPGPHERVRLGITIAEAPPEALAGAEAYSAGVRIQDVEPGLPGDAAGLEPGDIIVEFDGEKVESPARLQERIGALGPGATVELKFIRDGQEHTARVRLEQ